MKRFPERPIHLLLALKVPLKEIYIFFHLEIYFNSLMLKQKLEKLYDSSKRRLSLGGASSGML